MKDEETHKIKLAATQYAIFTTQPYFGSAKYSGAVGMHTRIKRKHEESGNNNDHSEKRLISSRTMINSSRRLALSLTRRGRCGSGRTRTRTRARTRALEHGALLLVDDALGVGREARLARTTTAQ